MGGDKVEGRRVADGNGRPVVLTALGSGEKLFAVLPLAILSVASVAGLSAMTDGDANTSSSPADSGAAAGPVAHETAARHLLARETPSLAPAAVSATRSRVATSPGPATGPSTISPASTHGSTDSSANGSAGSPAEIPAAADIPAAEAPATPAPTSSPTTAPEPTASDPLTEAEATAQCVASGISAADVLALGTCVEDLLG